MDYIAPLRTFDREDLLDLLRTCAHNLAVAYQETLDEALYFTSEHARDACDYLSYEIYKDMPRQLIH